MATSVPTFAELYAAIKAEIQARNPKLNDFQEGSVLDAYAGGGSILADEVLRYALHRFDALFLDRATGEDLDALVADRFRFTRHPATRSSVLVELDREEFEEDIEIPAGAIIEATLATGVVVAFEVESNFLGLASDPGPYFIRLNSVETGRHTNVPATGTTWELQSTSGTTLTSTSDVSFSPYLGSSASGGADAETDEALRKRAKLYYSTLVRGTAAALRTGALSVPTVRYATVSEKIGAGDLDTYVYVADASGSSNSLLVDAVRLELENWRAVGRGVFVLGAEIETIPLTILVKVRRGANLAGLTDSIRDAVIAYFGGTDPGTTIYLSAVETVVHEVGPDVRSADASVTTSPSVREVTPTLAANSLRVELSGLTVLLQEVA